MRYYNNATLTTEGRMYLKAGLIVVTVSTFVFLLYVITELV